MNEDLNAALGRLFAAMQDVSDQSEDALMWMLDAWFQDRRRSVPQVFDGARSDAMWWASTATPISMEAAVEAVSIYLPATPTHINAAKRICATCFSRLGDEDRARFMTWASRQPSRPSGDAEAHE